MDNKFLYNAINQMFEGYRTLTICSNLDFIPDNLRFCNAVKSIKYICKNNNIANPYVYNKELEILWDNMIYSFTDKKSYEAAIELCKLTNNNPLYEESFDLNTGDLDGDIECADSTTVNSNEEDENVFVVAEHIDEVLGKEKEENNNTNKVFGATDLIEEEKEEAPKSFFSKLFKRGN